MLRHQIAPFVMRTDNIEFLLVYRPGHACPAASSRKRKKMVGSNASSTHSSEMEIDRKPSSRTY